MRYKIEFSYDGTKFSGYQIQPGLRTVQHELEKAVSYLNQKQQTTVTSSGRTDRGVHALSQVAHFDLKIDIPIDKIKRGLNSNLPEDIHIICVKKVSENFHARFSAKKKQYIYRLNMGEYNPTMRNYIYQYNRLLDVNKIKEASSELLGTHDFRSLISGEDKRENSIRTIYQVKVTEKNKILEISFIADGFLKYQVRNMVGLLIDIGSSKKQKSDIAKILDKKDRQASSKTAPAEGLYLMKVRY